MQNNLKNVTPAHKRLVLILAVVGILGGLCGSLAVSFTLRENTPSLLPNKVIVQQEVDRYFNSLDMHPLQYTIISIEPHTHGSIKVTIAAAWPTMEEDHVDERTETLYLEKTKDSWAVQEDLSLN